MPTVHKLVTVVVALAMAATAAGPVAAGTGSAATSVSTSATDMTADEHRIDDCTTVDEPGEYVVTQDVALESGSSGPCILVTAEDVTIDGQSNTVRGGIDVTPGGSLTVSNAEIWGGVEVGAGGSLTVVDAELWYGHRSSILAQEEARVVVRNTSIRNPTSGILSNGATVRVFDSEIRGPADIDVPDPDMGVDYGVEGRIEEFVFEDSVVIGSSYGGSIDISGVDSEENAQATIRDSRVEGNEFGIHVRNMDLTIENTTAFGGYENSLDFIIPPDGANLTVTDSTFHPGIVGSIGIGGSNESLENTSVEVHQSVIFDRIYIRPQLNVTEGETPFNFTHNYWGADDGPGTDIGPSSSGEVTGPLRDPVTGALANGSGATIDPAADPTLSPVRFDPFLTSDPRDEAIPPETVHYQVDLVVGEPLDRVGPAGEGAFYGDQERLIRNIHGSTEESFIRSGTGGPRSLAAEHAECITYEDTEVANDTATVTFTVAEGCEKTITLASYVKRGPGFDRSMDQNLFDATTDTFGPGTHTITVALPEATTSTETTSRAN